MPKKVDPALKDRALRLVAEHQADYSSVTAVSKVVADQLGLGRETVRRCVLQAEIDVGARPGTSSEESAKIKRLKAENRRSREDNEILRKASIMDPLCGRTRAAAQGQLAEAWTYNPLGIVTVYGAGIAVLRATLGVLGGRWLNVTVGWTPRRRRVVWLVAGLLFVALEVRRQLRADLLMQTL